MFLRNEVQHCQANALENSKAPELIIPPHTFKRNCQWYVQCKVRSEFSFHHTCLLWELIPSHENIPPLVNKFRKISHPHRTQGQQSPKWWTHNISQCNFWHPFEERPAIKNPHLPTPEPDIRSYTGKAWPPEQIMAHTKKNPRKT